MQSINKMKIEFDSKSTNEAFARVVVAAFAAQLDPTLEELTDLKTAVSEAVTNAIIHGYEQRQGVIYMACVLYDSELKVVVEDKGVGIEDIDKARIPAYTTKPELERSGLGFSIMESFTDGLEIESSKGKGTRITMRKKITNS